MYSSLQKITQYIAQNIKNRIFFSPFSIAYFILTVITDFTNTFIKAGAETTCSKVNWGHHEHGCMTTARGGCERGCTPFLWSIDTKT